MDNNFNPATGNELNHTVHYCGQSFGVLPEHAKLIRDAINAAARGTQTAMNMRVTQMGSGRTTQLSFLIGPGVPVLLTGPPID